MNKRSSNEEERVLENWNWNINSDPGLGSLYDEMNKELSTIECKTGKKESQEKDYGISGNLTDERIEELTKSFNQTSTTVEVEDLSLEEVDDVQPKWVPPVELKRGRQGVFDVEEIVTVLRSSNARDICVIKMPDTLQISDYMVIATGISFRHCRSMTKDIQFIHKRKRSNKDSSLKVEGLDSENWLAFDLGNIILHLFTPETRELYDLESLWTLGEKYDDKCQEIEDEFGLQQTDLDWLKQLDLELTSDRKTS
ncbi:Mitochondrial assembly of ribosomal large subunit protein 1 [Mytilus coruscus]|uniref:Mitochondrial assembly of ribosomal large subunit protein 1 n=1 Tax=Mytilus coruscus TaxID=42192 RepID=A0A6J8DXK4_MYTCO|nr:Mitochondrial assembly of ribosomal large subunit protein 1 [Mytilus coruscus]